MGTGTLDFNTTHYQDSKDLNPVNISGEYSVLNQNLLPRGIWWCVRSQKLVMILTPGKSAKVTNQGDKLANEYELSTCPPHVSPLLGLAEGWISHLEVCQGCPALALATTLFSSATKYTHSYLINILYCRAKRETSTSSKAKEREGLSVRFIGSSPRILDPCSLLPQQFLCKHQKVSSNIYTTQGHLFCVTTQAPHHVTHLLPVTFILC